MKKNMLNKVRRTKRVRLTNSIRRILERKKLPADGQVVEVVTKYGHTRECIYDARRQFFLLPAMCPLPGLGFSRHEISSWKVTDEKV